MRNDAQYDIVIIGGGVNGCGIARDASGRGLRVLLCEKRDLAQATSSASTKLFHGGLRYLEHYEFRLVRQALAEREVLLGAMPHISWPMRFVLPHHKGLRPAWLLRLGLFLYDHIGGRRRLPGTRTLDLTADPAGAPLKPEFRKGFEYSDGWVDDSRLVVLNARDAAERGAEVATQTAVVDAEAAGGMWTVTLQPRPEGPPRTVRARMLVNAAGPWVVSLTRGALHHEGPEKLRLVRGSHIVTRRLFDHDRAYILQHGDGRVIFAIPYEDDFTLIGTTDVDHDGDPSTAKCTDEERDYLCALASEYFREPVRPADVVHTYSGVRPLLDDGASDAQEATRDYRLKMETIDGAPVLTVFGGKITTYRRLAEKAMAEIAAQFPGTGGDWTAGVPLPGGDFEMGAADRLAEELCADAPAIDLALARRLVRAYGTEAALIVGGAQDMADLGRQFGHGLTEAEVRHMIAREWARTAEDVLWRRSKLGLRFSPDETGELDRWMRAVVPGNTMAV